MGDKQNNSFWSPKARAPRFGEESKGEKRRRKKEEEKKKIKVYLS